ncbi:MAG: signal recognition particle-docking protein FtsY [Candidatus Odinarchaeia archaeon]
MLEKLKQGFKKFTEKLTTKELTEKKIEEALWDLKVQLISNDVAVEVADKIAEDITSKLTGKRIGLLEKTSKIVEEALKDAINNVLSINTTEKMNLVKKIKERKEKPYVIALIGVNGVGKTLTVAKLGYFLKKKGITTVFAASDTFRAGSIEQLEKHADKLDVRVIKQKYGADPAAVAYDAVNYARAKNIDSVIIDTSGRVQTDKNLMEEVKKIIRIAEPDLTIFIGDSLAGNDVFRQVKEFQNTVQIDGSILTKVDADVKGGAALSISYITKKPILFIGVGGEYKDLEEFKPDKFIKLLLPN